MNMEVELSERLGVNRVRTISISTMMYCGPRAVHSVYDHCNYAILI